MWLAGPPRLFRSLALRAPYWEPGHTIGGSGVSAGYPNGS